MAIFKKSDKNETPDLPFVPKIEPTYPAQPKIASVIGSTLVFKGELSADEDLIIEGHVEGTIAHHDKHLTVGEHGRVKADIHASSVIVLGQLIGDIHCEGMVSLAKGADVKGNVFCANIIMEEGARFQGNIDMGEPSKVTVSKASVQVEPIHTDKASKVAGQTAKSSVY